jgi:hypothetical protein
MTFLSHLYLCAAPLFPPTLHPLLAVYLSVNSKALSLDDRCVKAMYRRAQAYKVRPFRTAAENCESPTKP